MPPNWQTDELAEEWVEDGESSAGPSGSGSGSSTPLAISHGVSGRYEEGASAEMSLDLSGYFPADRGRQWGFESDEDDEWPTQGEDMMSFTKAHGSVLDTAAQGTFIIHSSLAPPRTPGKIKMKDFFTPLKLESMFEPPEKKHPTPPPSGPFTFLCALGDPQAASTPPWTVPAAPAPAPVPIPATPARLTKKGTSGTPLKLFQFTYDTYTREHLSALVDEILPGHKAKAAETRPALRSAKRVKLSPKEDYKLESDVGARIRRVTGTPSMRETGAGTPGVGTGGGTWRDRAAEARALMDDIRRGDWSTLSSRRADADSPSALPVEQKKYANLRNEAADLMAAIKKRVFSGASDVEASYYHEQECESVVEQEQQSASLVEQESGSVGEQESGSVVEQESDSVVEQESESDSVVEQESEANPLGLQRNGPNFLTSSSATIPSYTKHPGTHPPKLIRPADVREVLGERVGDMVFDRERGCWVGGEASFSFGEGSSNQEEEEEEEHSLVQEDYTTSPSSSGEDENEEVEEEEELTEVQKARMDAEREGDESLRREAEDNRPTRSVLKTQLTRRRKRRSVSFSDGRLEGPIVDTDDDDVFSAQLTFGASARSFMVTHDALLGALTDAEPWTAYWDRLEKVSLAWPFVQRDASTVAAASTRPPLTSLARLAEFLPSLRELDVSHNPDLAYLTGMPPAVRRVEAKGCALGDAASWGAWDGLTWLDVSCQASGCLTTLSGLSLLVKLTHLYARGNSVRSLDGLQDMHALRVCDLGDNDLRAEVCLTGYRDLQELYLDGNARLESVSVRGARELVQVDLERCRLAQVQFADCGKVRVVKVSTNRLERLDLAGLGGLRTVYADGNPLAAHGVVLGKGRVEVVSLRECWAKDKAKLRVSPLSGLRDVKRLYLSGTMGGVQSLFTQAYYTLTYLELANCGLAQGDIPPLAPVCPAVRSVNVNYNFLETLTFLAGCARVRRVSLVGCRVASVRALVRDLKALGGECELEVVDVRGNPCVGGWYLPICTDADADAKGYPERDIPYRRALPDKVYAGRLVYRGLVMELAPGLRMLDGVPVGRKERDKARELVGRVRG